MGFQSKFSSSFKFTSAAVQWLDYLFNRCEQIILEASALASFFPTIGIISAELRMADHELETARIGGRELRFPKEKIDILMLAASQMSSTSESST